MSEFYKTIDIEEIQTLIPHRYPFLLVDKVQCIEEGEEGVGVKNVTINEPFFPGHFPSYAVMPGVLIIEAMAQTAAIIVVDSLHNPKQERKVYFMGIDNARFRNPVIPGDKLHIHVKKLQTRRNVWKFQGTAKVNSKITAEATFMAMIMDA